MQHAALPKAIILLAGIGSRLGKPYPKGLTALDNGETILSRQVRILTSFGLQILAVVGFKKDLIMEAVADILYAYNPYFDTTNTSKSLLCGLKQIQNQDVLWLNGDVVFDEKVIESILASNASSVAVNNYRVGAEEIKYTLNNDGFINTISKNVTEPLGEALGINLIKSDTLSAFISKLDDVDDNDYFERAMELLISEQPNIFKAVDVSQYGCVEVDFSKDLEQAKSIVANDQHPSS